MALEDDAQKAKQRGLTFNVSTRAKKGAPWAVVSSTDDLADALTRARGTTEFEVAVFVSTPAGGFMYWTSKRPDTLNSSVLDLPL